MTPNLEQTMQLGLIGLGRMGASMARRLMKKGHSCVVHDTRPEARAWRGPPATREKRER